MPTDINNPRPRLTPLTQLFPPELRTASIVPRWSIVWTLTRDTVANHSFYVALYARKIAQLIGWTGSKEDLMFMALVHDLDELITGDIVSPVKAEILDFERASQFIDHKMKERLPDIASETHDISLQEDNDELMAIIQAADRLDALLFLIGERRMGNGVISSRIEDATNRFFSIWMELPAEQDFLQEVWQTVMLPVIRLHEEQGGDGV